MTTRVEEAPRLPGAGERVLRGDSRWRLLPFLGPAYEDESGKVDIHLTLSFMTMFLSSAILIIVGVISGWLPAMQAAKLDPVEALRYE